MVKVMHILNTGKYSGAENVAITIINSTNDECNSTYVSLNGPIKEYLEESKIHYYPVKKVSVKNIKKAITEIRPDIIHAHDFTVGVITALTGTKTPIINHIHNNSPWIKRLGLKSIVYAVSCLKYKKILTVSDSVMDEFIFGDIFKSKSCVVGNPIDLKKISSMAGSCDFKKYDIAFLGRISPPKNPMLFIKIIYCIKKRIPEVKVIMIGDGELKDELVSKIDTYGLNDNIDMVGFQKNPYVYLNQAKLLLMPSSWEGYGLAAVEALALGLPVVCSNVGGLPSIVNDNCGYVCSTEKEYISNIENILSDNKLLENKSRSAITRANEIGDIQKYSKRLLKLYGLVIDKNH